MCFSGIVVATGVVKVTFLAADSNMIGVGLCTLGSGGDCCTLGSGEDCCTLGSGRECCLFVTCVGFVALLRIVATSNSAFFVVSPSFNVGIVVLGGLVRMSIISVVACLRKSSSDTFGNGISVGKKVTVSTSLSCLVVGK